MDIGMGAIIGLTLGGLISVYVIYRLLHWALLRRIISNTLRSRIVAALAAYPCSVVLQGYATGNLEEGGFNPEGLITLIFPTLIIVWLAYVEGRSDRQAAEA